MTAVDALNVLLSGVGSLPVTDYFSPHPDAIGGRAVLERTDREIQERGWWFNRDYDLELQPDTDGKVLVPQNTLRIDGRSTMGNTDRHHVVQRGSFLYDMQNNTFVFSRAVVVDAIQKLDFADLPTSIQSYIARTAAYEFSFDKVDQATLDRLQRLAFDARSKAMSDELRNGNFNAHRSPRAARILSGIQPHVRR